MIDIIYKTSPIIRLKGIAAVFINVDACNDRNAFSIQATGKPPSATEQINTRNVMIVNDTWPHMGSTINCMLYSWLSALYKRKSRRNKEAIKADRNAMVRVRALYRMGTELGIF